MAIMTWEEFESKNPHDALEVKNLIIFKQDVLKRMKRRDQDNAYHQECLDEFKKSLMKESL